MRYKTSYDFNEKSMESYFMTDEYNKLRLHSFLIEII